MPRSIRYWLLKTEPTVFSIDDLRRCRNQTTCWDGVRNYQARNFMRDMQKGDQAFLYHSNADPPAIVGIAKVVRTAYPDDSAWGKKDEHYDPKSTPEHPLWDMVDVKFVRRLRRPLSLDVLRQQAGLTRMELLRKGSRLSVQPVRPSEWTLILKLAGR